MDIRGCNFSWASYAYSYCILAFLCGDGLAAHYYDDRRGQPELQQAMDNAPLLPARNLQPFPSEHGRDVPFLLTEKTSALLSEALYMLPKIKDVRERKWFEAFVRRLGSLATHLEEDKSVKIANEVQIEVRKHTKEPEKDDLFEQTSSQHLADLHGQKYNIFENGEVELERDEGTAVSDLEQSPKLRNSTTFPSQQQAMEAAYDRISKEQLHEPIKYFIPAEPTMSDEMERELRSGKIVVLSHSLVRTNFKSKHTSNKKKSSVTESISSEQIPEGSTM